MWAERERGRLISGHYAPLPWSTEEWWIALTAPGGALAQHYTHVSREDGSQIAYTENDQKGALDRQTRMRPGRYLARFCPFLSADEVRDLAGRFAGANETNSLLLARTADEIEDVYVDGPSSCMSHTAGDYNSGTHPTRVYAAGDLAVAYLRRNGSIVARSLVWPEKKAHSQIYGDRDRLLPLLATAGYESGSVEGARLTRIPCGGRFVCPYIDHHCAISDNGTHLIIDSSGEYSTQSTSGVCDSTGERCSSCGDRYDEDAISYYECAQESLCVSCAEGAIGYCDVCSDYAMMDEIDQVGDTSVCPTCLSHNYAQCCQCREYASNYDTTHDCDGDSVCEGCLERHYTACDECEEWYLNRQIDSEGHCGDCHVEPETEVESSTEEIADAAA